MTVLIIGGTSGLGQALASLLREQGATVHVTGRSAGGQDKPHQASFAVTHDLASLEADVVKLVQDLPQIDLLIYAAGFPEHGHITELDAAHIAAVVNTGMVAPALLVKALLARQGSLAGLMAITSTSQWLPREYEPAYAAAKAGLAMLAESLSLDARIEKTLVVGPAGMNTRFWEGTGRGASSLLAPEWVAARILELWEGSYAFRLARILRDPLPEDARVQILVTREA